MAGNEQTRIEFQHRQRRENVYQRTRAVSSNLPIRNITDQDCDRWVKERGANLASETFVHELDVMKTVF